MTANYDFCVARTDGRTKDLLFGTIPGKRGRGRTNTRMSKNMKAIADISMAELLRLAQNRSQWRVLRLVSNDHSVKEREFYVTSSKI